jgi:tyrosyl-DNA phosphodiesterase 2
MDAFNSFPEQDFVNKLLKTKVYHYRPDKNAWRHVSDKKNAAQVHHPSSLMLVTWNVDFASEMVKERMEGVLRHLQGYVFQGKEPEACCIMLQEVHPDGLQHILDDEWVRKHFVITPISPKKWPMWEYGNVTLVSQSVVVSRAAILSFGHSPMGRGAVIMDVKLSTVALEPREITLRMINTHLASLVRKREEVKGGIVAGDMNSMDPKEVTMVLDVGLKDAWMKPNLDPSGFTWGQQPESEYPPARFDKVLYVERRKLYTVDEPRRIGIGIAPIDEYGVPLTGEFVSDHYGLMTSLRVQGYP